MRMVLFCFSRLQNKEFGGLMLVKGPEDINSNFHSGITFTAQAEATSLFKMQPILL